MTARSILAALGLLTALPGCADPDAAAEIEIRRTNALTAIQAMRDSYCALSPTLRQRLNKTPETGPAKDGCPHPTNNSMKDTKP